MRPALLEGLRGAPDAERNGALVIASGKRAVFTASLVPDPAGVRMTLMGRTLPAGTSEWSVRLNETPVGKLRIPPDLSLVDLVLPDRALVGGINQIELRRDGDGPPELALAAAWFEEPSSVAQIDVGTEAARPLLRGGWGPEQSVEERSVRALSGRSAEVRAPARPLPLDYALFVVAKVEQEAAGATTVIVSSRGLEFGRLGVAPTWTTSFVRVPLARLGRGESFLTLAGDAAFKGTVLVDRIGLVPIQDRVLIDAGNADARCFLADGFSFDEAFEGLNAVWSLGKQSRVRFALDPAKESYVLAIHAKAFPALAPLDVKVLLNGHAIGAFRAGSAFGIFELTVPTWNFATGDNELKLEYAATAEPRRVDARSSDARELALELDWLELRPESRGPRFGSAPQAEPGKPR